MTDIRRLWWLRRLPQYHMLMQNQVREAMPLLARVLDRAAQERKQ